MNTQSHAIINQFILQKIFPSWKKIRHFQGWVLFGSFLPDLGLFIFYIYHILLGMMGQASIWKLLYYDRNWQTFFSIFNSVPLFILIAAFAYWKEIKPFLIVALAGLLHHLKDFFLHADDGHMHLFPLTRWKFESPVSYWDPNYFGVYVSVAEAVIVLVLTVFLWKTVRPWWGRALLVLANLLTVSSYLVWGLLF